MHTKSNITYTFSHPMTEYQILEKAAEIIANKFVKGDAFTDVKAVLETNAGAVIFAHNHPSGIAEPSESDKRITLRLTDALRLIDVRVLDHIVVGKTPVSFAERGLI